MSKKCQLYHQPGSSSSRVAWFLFELEAAGIDIESIFQINYLDLSKGEHKTDEYKKINPFGKVPSYIDENGEVMIESGAIVLHLANKFNEKVPLVSKNKGKYYQYSVLATSTLGGIISILFGQLKFTPKENQDQNLIEAKTKQAVDVLQYLENAISSNDYFVDNTFSAADILLGATLAGAAHLDLLKDFTSLSKYVQKISSREAFKKAFAPKESDEVAQLKAQLRKAKLENSILSGSGVITLYHFPGSRSSRVLWMFYELGFKKDVEFKIVDINDKGWKYLQSDEYKKINPNSLVPAITQDKLNLFEAGAILRYLLRKYQDRHNLLPKNWTDENWARHHLYEYWCITSIDGALVGAIFGLGKYTNYLTKGTDNWWLQKVEPLICSHLGDNKYLQGNEFTATDILLGFSLSFVKHTGIMKKSNKKIQEYYQRILDRQQFRDSLKGTQITFE